MGTLRLSIVRKSGHRFFANYDATTKIRASELMFQIAIGSEVQNGRK